jgi:hypothetical protein
MPGTGADNSEIELSLAQPGPRREGSERSSRSAPPTCKSIDPGEDAVWIRLARYQLLIGKPNPITVAIVRMHPDDPDVIDDFLLEVTSRGLSLRGQFLAHVVQRTAAGTSEPPPSRP